ncbi:BTB/POZ domain-containing protein 6-A-like [Contarinia nasturtii]|uniref:BTB/POZ domain-containing protein 6-A-like n=1 Tax=Contarinia nasturtii TaxID=265458 RepID=UPI0012D4B326|nr:BTB/POZ domain-containing protein 6-A-like [Contarinia nasturtii]XP_031626918.1 BTB/POZ domain-containing protein 6-A-like [Contarinia nasturtii]
MAQNTEQHVPVEQQATKQYEFHLCDKSCASLYLQPDLTDVNFLFYEENTTDINAKKLIEKVPAHKLILASSSSVFRAEFYGSIKEKGDVEIVDSSPEAFKEFLQCFYLSTVTFTMKHIPEIMYLANKYMVADCMDGCAKYLNDNLTSTNVCWVYDFAILHEHHQLKQFCEEHIISNAERVLESDEFRTCSQKLLREILKLDLRCQESIVFDRCLAWAKNACQQNGLDEKVSVNLRNQLGDCLFLIRFGTMTIREFSEATLKCEGMFTVYEMGDIWRSISFKGFVSKKFNQIPRTLCWDESKVWKCYPNTTTLLQSLQGCESVFITSNKTTLLSGIYFVFSYDERYVPSTLNAKVSIVEIKGHSFATETGKILFEETKNMKNSIAGNYFKPPIPIVINASNTYQICLEFSNYYGGGYIYRRKLGEVISKNGLSITFQNDCGRDHIITGLELIDY